MISFIVPFVTVEKDKFTNLKTQVDVPWPSYNEFHISNSTDIVYSTVKTIKNINSLKCEKEILIIDNSHTFPKLELPNVRVIKGWQALTREELIDIPEFWEHRDIQTSLDNFECLEMWVSLAFHLGTRHAKGEYIVLQHNDVFYHRDCMDEMIQQMKEEELEYISVDNKKIWIQSYILHKDKLDPYLKEHKSQEIEFLPEHGGCVKTQKIGFADAYFFLCKRKFFDTYNVDWVYQNTNHGATMYCLENNLKYLHLGPYHDNPNWETENELRVYDYKDEPFLTHLKGGFSENKMSSEDYKDEFNYYLEELDNAN